ncbi:MAG: DUF4249 domain-containing protein [Ginsengibacter sp.]
MHFCINKYGIILLLFLICGCKKVIDVHLENSETQIVITGDVDNRPGPYELKITKTIDFNSDNIFPPVSGAVVKITGNGVTDSLTETSPGVYSTHILQGKAGRTYKMFVSIEGKDYTASSTMPNPVHLDSIDFRSGRQDALYAVANFQDPEGVPNYYQFIEYTDGEKFRNGRGNSVFDDRLSDGRYINRILYNDSSDIKSGIILTVQMNCVDKEVYNYLSELSQISGGGEGFSSPTPANPTSNIKGGALGYFSAHTTNSRSVVIP